MPANLYGVATPNPFPQPSFTIGNANVSCPAGVETNFVSFQPPPPISQGWYYPMVSGWYTLAMGATPPTSLVVGFRVNGGADLGAWSMYFGSLIANQEATFPVTFYGTSFLQPYPIGTFNLQVSLSPGSQPVTVLNLGTVIIGQWLRAPDQ